MSLVPSALLEILKGTSADCAVVRNQLAMTAVTKPIGEKLALLDAARELAAIERAVAAFLDGEKERGGR